MEIQSILGKLSSNINPQLVQILLEQVSHWGGISPLIEKFATGGFINKEDGMVHFSSEAIKSVFGDSFISNIATKFSMEPGKVLEELKKILPVFLESSAISSDSLKLAADNLLSKTVNNENLITSVKNLF